MPFIEERPPPGVVDRAPEPVAPNPPSERGIWRSAFDTENDVVGMLRIIQQQSFELDPNFNLWEHGKDDPIFQHAPSEFVSVSSLAEYTFVRDRVQSAMASRRALENAGLGGWLAGTLSAMASPTVLIPVGGVGVAGLRAGQAALSLGGRTALAGGTGVAIQEGILQTAPNDRALEESLLNIGAGTLIAGGFGAGLGVLFSRGARGFKEGPELEKPIIPEEAEVYVPSEAPSAAPRRSVPQDTEARIEEIEAAIEGGEEWTVELREEYEELTSEGINPTQTHEARIGAEGDVRLEGTGGLANTLGRISPTVRGYMNKYSNTVRDTMRRLDGGGLLFRRDDGRYAADPDVATRAKGWEGVYYQAKYRSQRAIREYHIENRRSGEKLSTSEIMEQASDAIDGGLEDFQGPEIVKHVAQIYQEEVFRPFAEEAKRLDFTGSEHWRDPTTYVPHMARRTLIAADHEDFIEILSEYFGEVLERQTAAKLEAMDKRIAAREEAAEDIGRPDEEVAALREELVTLKREIDDSLRTASQKKLARAEEMRAQANETDDPAQAKALRERAKELEQGNAELRERHARFKQIRRRQTNLNKTALAIKEQIERKTDQIRAAEAQNLRTINSLVVKAGQTLKKIETEQDAAVRVKDINEFEADVQSLIRAMDDFAEKNPDYAMLIRDATTRGGKMIAGDFIDELSKVPDVAQFSTPAKLKRQRGTVRGQITRREKAGEDVSELRTREGELTARIDALEEDIGGIRDNLSLIRPFEESGAVDTGLVNRLNAALLDLNSARQQVIQTRAVRINKLEEQRAALDPEEATRRADELRRKIKQDVEKVYARLEERGIVFRGEEFDVSDLARKQAEVIAAKFTGETGRIPLTSTLLERGPELERTLEIDPLRVWSNGRRFADFLERDLDILSRLYTRTVGSDFEVYREFGSLSPYGRASDGTNKTGLLARMQQDFENARTKAQEEYASDKPKLEREQARIARSRRIAERDIQAVIDRIRHLRGIPEDPAGIPFRAGRALLNLNTLRLMGSVVVSSMADPARLVIKQGMRSVYRDGFQTLFNNMKAIRGMRSEVKSFAVGLDVLTHGRLAAMADIFDDYAPGTKVERGLQYATNNMGRIAGFDYWNAFWKQTAGVMTMQRVVHDIQRVLDGTGDVAGAERFLAQAGISDEMAGRIWAQMTDVPEGAENYKGVLVPNVAEWEDLEAARAFRTAILRVVDDTIVTPGPERPLLFDGSMMGRLIFQFRSFAFASLTKTLMFGAQELKHGNLNIPIGMAMSLGLGAMSWWSWSQLTSDKTRKTMENAGFDRWVDEAINRSGLLGPMQEALTVSHKIPWLAGYTSFSGEATTRAWNPYRNPFVDAFGPSIGLLKDLQTIAGTADEPREATVNAGARLLPFHNLFYMRPLVQAGKERAADNLGF